MSAAQLRRLIAQAKALGFQDDVDHWTAELAKLETRGLTAHQEGTQ